MVAFFGSSGASTETKKVRRQLPIITVREEYESAIKYIFYFSTLLLGWAARPAHPKLAKVKRAPRVFDNSGGSMIDEKV